MSVRCQDDRYQFRFLICTRDRPKSLNKCLKALKEACRCLSRERVAIDILDDSTCEHKRQLNRSVCGEIFSKGTCRIVTNATPLVSELLQISGKSKFALCRPLGTSIWDLAGARNLAFAYAYASSRDQDLIVFLDDDICLNTSWYNNTRYKVYGRVLLNYLAKSMPAYEPLAIGVPYVGRVDLSILDHLSVLLANGKPERSFARPFCDFPAALPTVNTRAPTASYDFSPGISGAFLATNRLTLRHRPLPRCYNEDWIWLLLLKHRGGTVRCVERPVLHAGPCTQVSLEVLQYQMFGDVLYHGLYLLMSCENTAPTSLSAEHIRKALRYQLELIQQIKGGALALTRSNICSPDEVRGVLELIRLLEQMKRYAQSLDPYAVCSFWKSYLDMIPKWRALLAHVDHWLGYRRS